MILNVNLAFCTLARLQRLEKQWKKVKFFFKKSGRLFAGCRAGPDFDLRKCRTSGNFRTGSDIAYNYGWINNNNKNTTHSKTAKICRYFVRKINYITYNVSWSSLFIAACLICVFRYFQQSTIIVIKYWNMVHKKHNIINIPSLYCFTVLVKQYRLDTVLFY